MSGLPHHSKPHHSKKMSTRMLVFAVFAAATLFSITREWSAPTAGPRLEILRTKSPAQSPLLKVPGSKSTEQLQAK
jgi:hypothetical protein